MLTCSYACGLCLIPVLPWFKIESMLKKGKLEHDIKLAFVVIPLEVAFCVRDKFLECSPNRKLCKLQIESNFSVNLSSHKMWISDLESGKVIYLNIFKVNDYILVP